MKLNKIKLLVLILVFVMSVVSVNAKEQNININFKNLLITDLIKVTSKIINKNILMTQNIAGKVDFISNKPVSKDDILNILVYVLESKGYTIIDNDGILRVVRINDASKYNMPVYSNKKINTYQMVTEVFTVSNANVDYVSSKVRHLISKSAKLVTDKESNSIVLTDFGANIRTVKKVIAIISRDNKKHVEVVKLKNLKAETILADLKAVAKAIYNEKIEKEKVSILVNKDINSIMFVGKRKNVNYLKNYLVNIEKQGSLVEKVVEVIYLKNAEAKAVIKILTGIITNKKYKNPNDKPYASNDDESNSIILMGAKEEISYFKDLIDKLDIDRQQVYVQARIIEISEKRTKDVGVKYGLNAFTRGSSGLANFTSSLNGGTPLSLDAIDALGFSVSSVKSALSLGLSINLLKQNGAADVVSEPSLLCINNKASSIYVGETISIKTGTTTTTGGIPTDTFKREDIGLTLKVKPRISNGNKVLLEITTKLEDVGQTATNDNPNTSKKELETTAIVNNGESIILGGYIRSKKENTQDKVPFFGDIPILGALFRNNKEVNDKINLVIIITPYIIPKTENLSSLRTKLSKLKALEDKYTQDTIKELEKRKKLKEKKQAKKSENQGHTMTQANEKDELDAHEKRVRELLGL